MEKNIRDFLKQIIIFNGLELQTMKNPMLHVIRISLNNKLKFFSLLILSFVLLNFLFVYIFVIL